MNRKNSILTTIFTIISFTHLCTSQAADSTLQVSTVFHDCQDCPELVVIPPGSFLMGSYIDEDESKIEDESPKHQVDISYSFAVGRYEITRRQFDQFAKENPDKVGDPIWIYGKNDEPVWGINWQLAKLYVDWLAIKTGQKYRLLSSSEWEYVARAGANSIYPWGDDSNLGCKYANVADESLFRTNEPIYKSIPYVSCDDGYAKVSPVGKFIPNGFGVYDMIGNASEPTDDCYHQGYIGAPTDGSAWVDGSTSDCRMHIYRGGSNADGKLLNRSASYRSTNSGGIRVARTLNP